MRGSLSRTAPRMGNAGGYQPWVAPQAQVPDVTLDLAKMALREALAGDSHGYGRNPVTPPKPIEAHGASPSLIALINWMRALRARYPIGKIPR